MGFHRWAAMFRKMTYLFSHQAEALNLTLSQGLKWTNARLLSLNKDFFLYLNKLRHKLQNYKFLVWLFLYDWQNSANSFLTKLYCDWFGDIVICGSSESEIRSGGKFELFIRTALQPKSLRCGTLPLQLQGPLSYTPWKFVWDLYW